MSEMLFISGNIAEKLIAEILMPNDNLLSKIILPKVHFYFLPYKMWTKVHLPNLSLSIEKKTFQNQFL